MGYSIFSLNYAGILLGLALEAWGIRETPEIHPYLKLIINWKGRKQTVKNSPGAFALQGDRNQVLIGQANQNALELAQQVYTPLLNEVTSWLDPWTMNFRAWAELQGKAPHLLRLVPPHIAQAFKKAEPISLRIGTLNLSMNRIIVKVSSSAREKVGLTQGQPGVGEVSFRLFIGNAPLTTIYLSQLWFSGKPLLEYANEIVTKRYPGAQWDMELQIDGYTKGDKTMAVQFANEALANLQQVPEAVEIRQKYAEMRVLGADAMSGINAELDRLAPFLKV